MEEDKVQQWEYTDRCVDHYAERNHKSILTKMIEMGLDGWECVGIYEGTIYFKRPKRTQGGD